MGYWMDPSTAREYGDPTIFESEHAHTDRKREISIDRLETSLSNHRAICPWVPDECVDQSCEEVSIEPAPMLRNYRPCDCRWSHNDDWVMNHMSCSETTGERMRMLNKLSSFMRHQASRSMLRKYAYQKWCQFFHGPPLPSPVRSL